MNHTSIASLPIAKDSDLNFSRMLSQKILLNTERQSVAFLEIISGGYFQHTAGLDTEETVVVMKGRGKLEVGDETKIITPIALIKMTAEKVHKIFNEDAETLHIYWIKTTHKSNPNTYKATDEGIYLKRKEDCTEIVAAELERIYELFGKFNGNAQMHSVALVNILKDGASDNHFHPVVEESYMITEGEGKLVIDSEVKTVKSGDTVLIPIGKKHQIFNSGSQTLKLIVVCVPYWEPGCAVYDK